MSFSKVKGEPVTEVNENNDFTTIIPIGIILCFIEHLYYPQWPAEMFSNAFIPMEYYLKLSPDVDYSNVYLLRHDPDLIGIQKQNRSVNAGTGFKN